MQLSRTSSSSSTEVAGFRIEREVGRGPRSVVYEATQLSLHRRVALKLLAEPPVPGALRWPEHPRAVSLYAAGPCDAGYFVAMQLVRGPSLDELRGGDRLRLMSDIAEALDAAHATGIAHGAVSARNVLVADGRAYLSDFGLSAAGTRAHDLGCFAKLVSDQLGVDVPDPLPETAGEIVAAARRQVAPPVRVRRGWAVAGVAALCAGLAGVGLAWPTGSSDAPPARLPGTTALGSSLDPSGVGSEDCAGHSPSGSSVPCVMVQTRLDGRPVTARRDGVVRRWGVRGASGDIALEVLRRRGSTTYPAARTDYVRVPDEGPHLLPANLPIRAGDLVGLDVAPDAAVGVRVADGASLRRRFGTADLTPGSFDGEVQAKELLLRVEYAPGAEWKPAGLLNGAAAARAPAGRPLDSIELHRGLTVSAVKVRDRAAVDLFDGPRRAGRLFVAGARPEGRLGALYTLRFRFGAPLIRIQWRNPGDTVSHDFSVTRRAIVPID